MRGFGTRITLLPRFREGRLAAGCLGARDPSLRHAASAAILLASGSLASTPETPLIAQVRASLILTFPYQPAERDRRFRRSSTIPLPADIRIHPVWSITRETSKAAIEHVHVSAKTTGGREQLLVLALSLGKIKDRKPLFCEERFERENCKTVPATAKRATDRNRDNRTPRPPL